MAPPPPLLRIESAPAEPEPSIKLDPELQKELDARLPTESTLITRNPLGAGRRDDEDTQPGTRRR